MLSPMIFAVLLAITVLVMACVRRIPEGQVYAFRRMDGHVRMVGAGMHLVLPLIERLARKISLAGSSVAIDDLACSGAQNVRGVVYFQVLDPERAGSQIGDIEQHLRAAVRRLAVDAALPDAIETRRRWFKQTLNAELREHGLLIARVDLAGPG